MFSLQQLVEHAPLVVGDDAVADPHHDDLLAVGQQALEGEDAERAEPTSTRARKFLCT